MIPLQCLQKYILFPRPDPYKLKNYMSNKCMQLVKIYTSLNQSYISGGFQFFGRCLFRTSLLFLRIQCAAGSLVNALEN